MTHPLEDATHCAVMLNPEGKIVAASWISSHCTEEDALKFCQEKAEPEQEAQVVTAAELLEIYYNKGWAL